MAKRKRARGGPNKSDAIRDYLAKNKDAKPKEIIEALAKQGIKVSQALVGNVKYTSGGKKTVKAKKKEGRPPRAVLSVDDLLEAKRLADQLGGISQAKQALETLEKLV